MKARTKFVTGIIALFLSVVFLCTTFLLVKVQGKETVDTRMRTIKIDDLSGNPRESFAEFDEPTLFQNGSLLKCTASKSLPIETLDVVDVVALEDTYGETAFDISYSLTYEQGGGGALLTISFTSADGTVYSDTINGIVTTNAIGNPDLYLILDDEVVLLSDLIGDTVLDEVGFFSNLWAKVKKAFQTVVRAVEIVCTSNPLKVIISIVSPSVLLLGGVVECAVILFTENQRMDNYNNNKIQNIYLSSTVDKSGYIDNQRLYSNWKFACNPLSSNGCGVIASFNALKFSGKIVGDAQELMQLISNYESSPSALFNGTLGLNPLAIEPMLKAYGANIKTYSGIMGQAAYELDCESLASNQMAILCYFYVNASNIPQAHYICIFKNTSGQYVSLNIGTHILHDVTSFLRYSIKTVNGRQDISGKGFIQGWIVTK